jgi:hypothetical protein
MPRLQMPLKKTKARSCASHNISWLSRIFARANIMRLWQSLTCATFTLVVTPPIRIRVSRSREGLPSLAIRNRSTSDCQGPIRGTA